MGQPPRDDAYVTTTKPEAAAAVRIGGRTAGRKRADLLDRLRSCFARIEPFLQAGKYVTAVMSELPKRNGWTISEHVRDRTPDKTQRLLSRASWDGRGPAVRGGGADRGCAQGRAAARAPGDRGAG